MKENWLPYINNYPEPIKLSYRKIQEATEPYVRVRHLIDCFECFLKFITICCLQGMVKRPEFHDLPLGLISGRLYRPTLGVWQDLLEDIVEFMGDKGGLFFRELPSYLGVKGRRGLPITREKTQIFSDESPLDTRYVRSAIRALVHVRNWYAHNAVPDRRVSESHFSGLLPVFNKLLASASFLTEYRLEFTADNQPVPYIVRKDGLRCNLFPLVLLDNGELFLYKDAQLYRKRKLTYQSYMDARSFASSIPFDDFRKLYPLEKADGTRVYLTRTQLSEEIVGREKDLERVLRRLETSGIRRILVTGFPGIGKSAFSIYLTRALKDQYYCVNVYFDGNDKQTLSLETLYESFLQGLQRHGLVRRTYPPDFSAIAVREALEELFQAAASRAENLRKRILLVVDGLDEAVSHNAEVCLEALPHDLPEWCRLVLLSRPIPYVKKWWTNETKSGNKPLHLHGLSEEAVRSLLEEAIPWYILNQQPEIIKRAHEASKGHPLYLKHLVEAVLEGREDIRLEHLPGGMKRRYREIFQRVRRNPLAFQLAFVLAVSSEPLTLKDLEEILQSVFPAANSGTAQQALDDLMEVLREVPVPGNRIGYHFFHLSVTEYLREQFPKALERAKIRILAWRVGDETDVQACLKTIEERGREPDSYERLIPPTFHRTASREILVDLFVKFPPEHPGLATLLRLDRKGKSRMFKRFVLEVLKRQWNTDLDLFTRKIVNLTERFRDETELYRVALEAMLKRDLKTNAFRTLARLVAYRLINGDHNETFLQLMNDTASLAGRPDGFRVFLEILRNILPFEDLRGAGETRAISRLLSKAVTSKGVLSFAKGFIQVDQKLRRIRGGEPPPILAFRILQTMLLSPSLWGKGCTALLILSVPLVKEIFNLKGMICSALTFFELILQGIPLIFTSRDRPALTLEGVRHLSVLKDFLREIAYKLSLPYGIDIYEIFESEMKGDSGSSQGEISDFLLFFGVTALLGMHLKDMFNYSRPGVEAVADYGPKEVETLKGLLPLLSPDNPIDSHQEKKLVELLAEEDAFQNYFAMLTIIIHSGREFETGKEIIQRMLDTARYRAGYPYSRAIWRLKIYRQAISIFSYIFRRIENLDLAGRIACYVMELLDSLMAELQKDDSLRMAFARMTIFDQNDPFNPLLPLGIYCSGRFVLPEEEVLYSQTLSRWIEFVRRHRQPVDLHRRLVFELIPLSYFAPDFAMERTLELLENTVSPEERHDLLIVLGAITHVAPGTLERLSERMYHMQREEVCLEELESEILNIRLRRRDLEWMFRAMRVFAWHECITTIMVSHRRIAQKVIEGFLQALEPGVSINHLIARVGRYLAQDLFSDEIEGSFFKIFGIEEYAAQ